MAAGARGNSKDTVPVLYSRPTPLPNLVIRSRPMTLAPLPQPLDPTRYRTAAAHYEQGRVPYAAALIRRVAEVTGLGSQHRVLDLGCGPGPLTRRFAPLAREVVAMDPTPEMLAAARTLAGKAANI